VVLGRFTPDLPQEARRVGRSSGPLQAACRRSLWFPFCDVRRLNGKTRRTSTKNTTAGLSEFICHVATAHQFIGILPVQSLLTSDSASASHKEALLVRTLPDVVTCARWISIHVVLVINWFLPVRATQSDFRCFAAVTVNLVIDIVIVGCCDCCIDVVHLSKIDRHSRYRENPSVISCSTAGDNAARRPTRTPRWRRQRRRRRQRR
jgi:hypothetical protein